MQNRLSYSFQTLIFPNFHPIFQNFALALASYFSKNFAGKIGAALDLKDSYLQLHIQTILKLWVMLQPFMISMLFLLSRSYNSTIANGGN